MTYADATFYVGVHFAGDDSRDLSTPVDPRQHTMGIKVLCKLIGIRIFLMTTVKIERAFIHLRSHIHLYIIHIT